MNAPSGRRMFDTYQVGPRAVDVTVRHEEKRAPTDESVRLLREMEGAAKDQVVQSLRIESCGVEAVVHRIDSHMDCKTHYAIHYKVNGVKRECRLTLDDYRGDIHERLEAIWKCLSEDLAAYLMSGIAKTVAGK